MPPRVEVGCQMRAFADAHRVEIGQCLLDGRFDARRDACFERRVGVD